MRARRIRKPNEFGRAPDGYQMQIDAASTPGYTPTLEASTPCFPSRIAQDGVAVPVKIPTS
ncbi:hypothetical protein CIW52_06705 [Mycolicibacterium sp. P9-64]|nr:hypothetical protein CIW52_06705 [Mycolicibacterium sp. P9-64]